MAYYRIQAQDRAHEQWKSKMEELHQRKVRAENGRMGSMHPPASRTIAAP
jgi:hypothetical protein